MSDFKRNYFVQRNNKNFAENAVNYHAHGQKHTFNQNKNRLFCDVIIFRSKENYTHGKICFVY